MPKDLVLSASLVGKALTNGAKTQVTLNIAGAILTLNLNPEDCAIFPDLQSTTGGGHPLLDPTVIGYNPAPAYTVTISQTQVKATNTKARWTLKDNKPVLESEVA